MEQLGVSPKQKGRARQTFMKSAQYAGFIDASSGRFVKPGITQADTAREEKLPREKGNGDGDGTDGLNLDPLLIALLKKIPDAEKGWPAAQRVRWFRTFKASCGLKPGGCRKSGMASCGWTCRLV
jgi:hypothetical protein